jgi:membrane protein implicated in regulation of membrane protease activity
MAARMSGRLRRIIISHLSLALSLTLENRLREVGAASSGWDEGGDWNWSTLGPLALLVAIIFAFFVPWPWNILVVLGGVLAEIGEVIWGRRLARRWRPHTGAEAMIGMRAEVVSPCRPTGQVRVNGELWEATCEEGAGVGDVVIVRGIDGLTLLIDLAPKGPGT